MLMPLLRAAETGMAIQIQNFGESYFHRPLLSRLKAYVGCQFENMQQEQAQMTMKSDRPYTVN